MTGFIFGFVCGAVAAVASPWLFKKVAAGIAKARAAWADRNKLRIP